MLTKTGTHAIRALMVLADLNEGQFAGAVQIAGKLEAPANYLSKLLQSLSRTGLVISQKGQGGGFRLAKPADEIRLIDIIEPVEPVERWTRCVLGKAECSNEHPCALHTRWREIAQRYLAILEGTRLADLKADEKKAGLNGYL